MGALAPLSPWLPEDDLLLKNSVEAGASLESLAKGAVQFSRKFTVRELQDRWHSLLYDPVVSAEASFRMLEFEHSAPAPPSKFSRAGNSKENRSFSGKRKVKSVRSCYYALRKRIRNEPFNSMDPSFLVAPINENFFGNEDEPISGNCMLGDHMPNHYGLQVSNLDIMKHAFPEVNGGTAGENGCMAHGLHEELAHPVDEDFAMKPDNIHENIPDMFEENPAFTENGPGLEELGQPKQVPSLLGAEHLEANPPSSYGQIHNDPGNIFSEFEGNRVFHSPIPECDGSFENVEYSCALPEMSIWRAVEEISTQAIPVDSSLREKEIHTGDTFGLCDGADEDRSAPGCDFVPSDSNLKMQISCDDLKGPAARRENYLAELSNSLLNYEELLLMDDDGKEMIDKSYYDGLSLLLSSPNEVNQDHMPSPEPETSANPTNSSGIFPTESVEKVQMQPSASALDPQFPELIDGVICCTLNTEDQDIPCNDDVFLPIHTHRLSAPIAAQHNFKEVGNPISSSVKDFQSNQRSNGGNPVLTQRDQDNPEQSHASSQILASQGILAKGQLHPVFDCGVKFESPHLPSRTSAIASGGSIQINSVNIGKNTIPHARLKEESEEIAVVKDLGCSLTHSFLDKSDFGSDGYKCHERNASAIKQELDALAAIQDRQTSNAEAGSINIPDSEPVINPPTSEIGLSIESDDDDDDDLPYFSDIETMILDMDLDPDDQDLYEREVSKYKNEDSMKAIVRLEQGANSYMQRAIASHGAFAILYGRYSKHYIKKPEVSLGRCTVGGAAVDIDLAREGLANKISRRQAIISMDKAGSFHLKNVGRFSILVNNKEVVPGQSLSLNSSCLIEIRGRPFIFETSKICMKRFLDNISKEEPNS